jgi:hypothetical protein
MRTMACVLDLAGLEESKNCGFRKNFNIYLRKRGNVAMGICKEDYTVSVIRTATE